MSKKVALYAGVGTENQGLEKQVEKLKAWAESKGYEYDVFSEKVSSIKERPEFDKMMERVGEYDIIAVTKIDRFGHFYLFHEVLQNLRLIENKGADLVTIDQPINTKDEDVMPKIHYFLKDISVSDLMEEEKTTNEFGEEIRMEKIKRIAEKISKMPKEKIDNIWASAGWKQRGCEPNKALSEWRLEEMKKELSYAIRVTENLFHESPKSHFLEVMRDFEIC